MSSIKTVFKSVAKKSLKKVIRSPLKKFLTSFVKIIGKVSKYLCNKGGLFQKLGKLITSWKVTKKIAGFVASKTFDKLISFVCENIDIILSIGGLVSGFLDILIGDKKLNNKIVTIKF